MFIPKQSFAKTKAGFDKKSKPALVGCFQFNKTSSFSGVAAKHTPRKDDKNNTENRVKQGSRKRFATQRFFGKRRRNGAKRAGCESKSPKNEVYGDEGTAARSRPR